MSKPNQPQDVEVEYEEEGALEEFNQLVDKSFPVKFKDPTDELMVTQATLESMTGKGVVKLFVSFQIPKEANDKKAGKTEKVLLGEFKKVKDEIELEQLFNGEMKPTFIVEGPGKVRVNGAFAPEGVFGYDEEEDEE